jgi:trigger factor
VPSEEHNRLAERRVRLGLLLAEVGTRKEITVTEQEMQAALFQQARQYPGQERQFLEFVRGNAGAQSQIRAPIFEDKVVDYILELATVTEKTVTKDELQAEIEKLDEDAGAASSEDAGKGDA